MLNIIRIIGVTISRGTPRSYCWIPLGLILLSAQTGCKKVDQAETASPAPTTAITSSSAGEIATAASSIIGRTISFAEGGGSESFRFSGWSTTEKDYTWSEGDSAKLVLPTPAKVGALTLNMILGALISPPAAPSQTVEVFANGQKLADWHVADTAKFTVQIPAEVANRETTLSLEFRTPDATSPKALGLTDDGRKLGVRAYTMQLSKP